LIEALAASLSTSNGIVPYRDRRWLFEKLPDAKIIDECAALVPWNSPFAPLDGEMVT
jgi:hypothetical protein